jgi:hypothetical protein
VANAHLAETVEFAQADSQGAKVVLVCSLVPLVVMITVEDHASKPGPGGGRSGERRLLYSERRVKLTGVSERQSAAVALLALG